MSEKKRKIMKYEDDEIKILFPGSYSESEDTKFWGDYNKDYSNSYFIKAIKKIRFHEDDQEKYYETDDDELIPTQHVISGDGYLSNLYIYSSIDKQMLVIEINKTFEPSSQENKWSFKGVKELKINNFKVINWRTEYYKNRFEYFLLLGKSSNYLFVSTPYGEKEYIENILKNIEYK